MGLEPLKEKRKLVEIEELIFKWDKFCRGGLLLGLDRPINKLDVCFKLAKSSKIIKGFAVGRVFLVSCRKLVLWENIKFDAMELVSKIL